MINWLHKHKFKIHLTTFILMVSASIGLYFTTKVGANALIWALLGIFAIANIIAMAVK